MATGTFWRSGRAAGPVLPVLRQLLGQAQLLGLGPWPCLIPGKKSLLSPELPGWGHRDALHKVKLSLGLHSHCLGLLGPCAG